MTYPHFKGSYAEAGDPIGEYVLGALNLPSERTGGADWQVASVWCLGTATVGGWAGEIFVTLERDRDSFDYSLTFRPEWDGEGDGIAEQDAWDNLWMVPGTPEAAEAWRHILHDTDHGLAWAESAMNAGHHPGYEGAP